MIIFGVLLTIFISIAVLILRERSLSAKIEVEIAPSSSALFINDVRHKDGVVKVRPGSYAVVVSKSGFNTSRETITVFKGEAKYVGVALVSNSPSTADWYETHPLDAKKAEGISSKNFDIKTQQQAAKLPIIRELPWVDLLYRVDYGPSMKRPNDPESVALYITYYSESGKTQALQWLKFKSYTPDSTEMIFKTPD